LFRAFSHTAYVKGKRLSLPLQKALVDFGADDPFAKAGEKLKEHYGIEVPISAIRNATERHGQIMAKFKGKQADKEKFLIVETDGSMVPIVEIKTSETGKKTDNRKNRQTCWKEAKLSCARGKDKFQRFYKGKITTAEEAGTNMFECAVLAGMQDGTYVHAVGDGAPWIIEQFKLRFCNRGNYLIDFFHLCEYLSKAAIWCNFFEKDKWLKDSQEKLKAGKQQELFTEIKNKVEALQLKDETIGLIECHRYMEKRLEYLNYKSALDKNLPIGSGEIESSHRHVIQKRLKIAGAWWKIDNANHIIALRTLRLNAYWSTYWEEQKLVA
jgi:hypothetical protein